MLKTYIMFQDTYIPANSTTKRPQCRFSQMPVHYMTSVEIMEQRILDIRLDNTEEQLWFLEHPSLYTAGTSAQSKDLLKPNLFPIYKTGRGGQYTYHGPGQRIVYLMLDLKKRGTDIRYFIHNIEEWIIRTLLQLNIKAHRHKEHIGIWVGEHKIAAIGIRVRKWVTFHGVAINVNPDLTHFSGIIPCGIKNQTITSLVDLGKKTTMKELDTALLQEFGNVFK